MYAAWALLTKNKEGHTYIQTSKFHSKLNQFNMSFDVKLGEYSKLQGTMKKKEIILIYMTITQKLCLKQISYTLL
jgi:hypothetical protein